MVIAENELFAEAADLCKMTVCCIKNICY